MVNPGFGAARDWVRVWLLLAVFAAGSVWAKQMGPKIVVTAAQVAAAVANSPLIAGLQRYAADIGKLAMFESGGNLGINNGSCCTGVLQVNRGGLRAQCHCEPEEYARMPLQRQVDVWAKVTNVNADTRTVRRLMAMGSFGGRPVDGAMVLACIQLGPGNCARTLAAGTCATRAGADSNGVNFCTMADSMRGGAPAESVAGAEPGADFVPRAESGRGAATVWNPISPEEAFADGAGVDMALVRSFAGNAVAVAALLWLAWVAQAQFSLFRKQRIDGLTGLNNVVASAVVALLVLFFALD